MKATRAAAVTAAPMSASAAPGRTSARPAISCVSGSSITPAIREICDLKDNDCDGSFDEGLTNMGPCGIKTCVNGTNNGAVCQTSATCTGGGTCQANVGICAQGTLSCDGGTPTCHNFVTPTFEACDGLDNDCDGSVDEDFFTATDTSNCGTCGTVCMAPANSVATCTLGSCGFTCKAGYHDNNNDPTDGCEYGPCFKSGDEVCDGEDNDCDGVIDNVAGSPPAILLDDRRVRGRLDRDLRRRVRLGLPLRLDRVAVRRGDRARDHV